MVEFSWKPKDRAHYLAMQAATPNGSRREVAEACGVTRNTVCGWCARNQIPATNPVPTLGRADRGYVYSPRASRSRERPQPTEITNEKVLNGTRATRQTNVPATAYPGMRGWSSPGRSAQACQFIAGEASRDDGCKCGAPVVPGSPWCGTHKAICTTRVKASDAPAESEAAA